MKTVLVLLFSVMSLSCNMQETSEDSQLDFNSGEHMALGDLGFKNACLGFDFCPSKIERDDGKMSFTYGELIAFGGDFYGSIDEMYLEKEKSFWNFFRNDIVDTKKLFYQEAKYIEDLKHGHAEGEYPDASTSFAWNFPGYIGLAEDNLDHFGFHNVLRYIKEHKKALEIAKEAHSIRLSNFEDSERLLEKAIFYNGFADHFLTDGFAAGHIRNPRKQINAWAENHNLGSRDAGLLTKILHDRDGEVIKSGAHGLPVKNSRGDSWFARCDAQLFFNYEQSKEGIHIAVEAVALSLKEVLHVYETGELPQGTFKALELVPFVDPSYKSLHEIFYAGLSSEERKSILNSVDWYFKVPGVSSIDAELLERFFSNLDSIMLTFGEDNTRIKSISSEISRHIPDLYLEHYGKVR